MLKSLIQGLRLYSLLLFLIPTIAILVSLFLNNHLSKYNSSTYLKGKIESFVMECNLGNGYCLDTLITTELHKCSKFTISKNYYIDGELFGIENKLVHILSKAESIAIGLPESKTIGLISADQLKLLGEKNKIEIKLSKYRQK